MKITILKLNDSEFLVTGNRDETESFVGGWADVATLWNKEDFSLEPIMSMLSAFESLAQYRPGARLELEMKASE